MAYVRECPCGSDEWPEAVYDGGGIFVLYVCSECREEKLSKYHPDIFTDSNNRTDELVD
jgi:hypothetical protein